MLTLDAPILDVYFWTSDLDVLTPGTFLTCDPDASTSIIYIFNHNYFCNISFIISYSILKLVRVLVKSSRLSPLDCIVWSGKCKIPQEPSSIVHCLETLWQSSSFRASSPLECLAIEKASLWVLKKRRVWHQQFLWSSFVLCGYQKGKFKSGHCLPIKLTGPVFSSSASHWSEPAQGPCNVERLQHR